MKIYQQLSSTLSAMNNCIRMKNDNWKVKHYDKILEIVKDHMPHGSGFDNGTYFDFDFSNPEKLVLKTSFHHMNEGGYYDGWTEHSITVIPSLQFGFNIKVSGNNKNQIKEYIEETFDHCLNMEYINDKI